MLILATMFVKLFDSQEAVCLRKDFFAAFAASQNRKNEKASFFQLS